MIAIEPSLPRIFVQIASFRDPECQSTVVDLFAKAARPERVQVGICWQFKAGEDDHCFVAASPRPAQVRVVACHADDSGGANWVRVQAARLWNGEDYVLQIDSHMRFAPGWDEYLIEALGRCSSHRAVLSTLPAGYALPNTIDPAHSDLRSCLKVTGVEHPRRTSPVHLGGGLYPNDGDHAGLLRSPFIASGFVFMSAAAWQDVPLDPHIYFYGDDIHHSARLWTHGYDVF